MSFLKSAEDKVERALAPLLPIPAFGDLSKAANDVCNIETELRKLWRDAEEEQEEESDGLR